MTYLSEIEQLREIIVVALIMLTLYFVLKDGDDDDNPKMVRRYE